MFLKNRFQSQSHEFTVERGVSTEGAEFLVEWRTISSKSNRANRVGLSKVDEVSSNENETVSLSCYVKKKITKINDDLL